ncbi:MAG: hypothetical protein Q9170_002049 [Blastenia crenularia]
MAGNPSSSSGRQPSAAPAFHPTLPVRKRRPTIDLVIPAPLNSDDLYTEDCVQARLEYAEQRLTSTTRYLTPNSMKLLQLYACYDFLLEAQEDDWPQERRKHVDEVRGYEAVMIQKDFLKDVSSPGLLADIIKFRQYTYWARYGDYAGHLVSSLRIKSQEQPRSQFASTLSGQHLWTEISEAIRSEEVVWKQQGSRDVGRVKTTYSVYENCQRIGIGFHNMIFLIHLYAERNLALNLGLQQFLENQEYSDIAQCLYEDLRDLSSVAPPNTSGHETVMRAVLEQLRDEWFQTSHAPQQPKAWIPLSKLLQVHADLQPGKQPKQNNSLIVAQNAAKRLALGNEQEELLVQAATSHQSQQLPPPGPGSPKVTGKGKGKAKATKAKAADVSDRKTAWDQIMYQQEGQYNGITATLAKQREINRIVSAYRSAYGDDPPPNI